MYNIYKMQNKKTYVIPTKHWLKPLKEFISDDNSSHGFLMLAEHIDKGKVIVKITCEDNKKLGVFNKILSNYQNYIKVYYTFSCKEDSFYLDNRYDGINTFCNGNTKGDIITLEIMKKYKGTLNNYKGKCFFDEFLLILTQLYFAQLEAFYNYGIIHNDMHLSNILYEKTDQNKYINIKYSFYDMNLNLNTFFIPIISDFDEMISFNKNIFTKYNPYSIYNDDGKMVKANSLLQNIIDTTLNCLELLKSEDKKLFYDKLLNYIQGPDIYEKHRWSEKHYRSLAKENYTYDVFINKETKMNILIIDNIISKIKNNPNFSLFPESLPIPKIVKI